MRFGNALSRLCLPATLAGAVFVSAVQGQGPVGPPDGFPRTASKAPLTGLQAISPLSGEHPLMPALRWAQDGLASVQKNVSDYSTTLVKRERVRGKVGETEYIFTKVRHNPFSVYMHFLGPADKKGREVIFIEGRNNGKMWAHTTGVQDKLVGTVSLDPAGLVAMEGERYPLTEVGLMNLVRRLAEVAEMDTKYGECDVKFLKGAKINSRVCTCIEVLHPVPRKNFRFHLARVFVDDTLNLPIRYEAYDWAKDAKGKPELIEEYTYLNLKVNPGLSDADFDIHNPSYHFH